MNATQPQSGVPSGYSLVRSIGEGGMGTVHLVRETSTSRLFALKRMHHRLFANDRAARRFAREIEVLQAATQVDSNLPHPNIVTIHAAGSDNLGPWFTMEYCERGSIGDLIGDPPQPIGPGGAVQIALQILDALDYLHQLPVPDAGPAGNRDRRPRGIVHRDIKPTNVLLAAPVGCQVKIADFGLAKAFELAGASGVTSSHAAGGDWGFAPRCQMVDFRDCGPDVDVWATAATLFFLLTGEYPRDFSGQISFDVVVQDRPARPVRSLAPHLPAELAEVIDEALLEDDDVPLGFSTAIALRSALCDAARRCGLEFDVL
jgi:eukaryotic-like serine/threonine-protein kinase